jgi:hypothetical protein
MLRRSPVLFLLLFLDLTLVSSACAAEDTDFQKIQSSFLGKWKGDLNVGGTVESEWFKLPTNFICAKVDVDSPIGKDSYILIIGRDHEALKIWYHKSGEEVRESTVSWDGDTMVSVGPPSKLGLTHFFCPAVYHDILEFSARVLDAR